jgi:uncharacterized repeat protein (TIGR01451 family)
VQVGDDDPLGNTVTVLYHPDGFPNDISDSDSHSVNLFQPSVVIDKTGDTLSKVGDAVTYTFTVTNTSSSDSPNLVMDTITDTLLGDLSDAPRRPATSSPPARAARSASPGRWRPVTRTRSRTRSPPTTTRPGSRTTSAPRTATR